MFGMGQPADFGPGGFGGPGSGGGCDQGSWGAMGFGGWGGPGPGGGRYGPGPGGGLRRAAIVAMVAQLLDGPADAAELIKRTSKSSHGAIKPPRERVELLLAMLAARGVVSLDDGEATLTELGRNLLAWRGVNADTARVMLGHAEKFADALKIRRELKETAELARTITWSGTDEQKKVLKKAKKSILVAVKEAKRSLHEALAVDDHGGAGADRASGGLSDKELKELRAILAKLTG